MISDALQVGILIQHRVVGIQEEVKGVLVQEVHLEQDKKDDKWLFGTHTSIRKHLEIRDLEIKKKEKKKGLSRSDVYLVERLHGEVDAAACRGQRQVLL